MADRSGYAEGTPSWVDLGAADFLGAQRFYRGLFGWDFQVGAQEYGQYSMCQLDGRSVAGLAPAQSEMQPSVWSTYFATDDIAATARRITDHGGTLIMEPMDVMDAGRMCFALDPTGAAFGAWQAGAHRGAEKRDEPGSLCWNELNTRDGATADAFYSRVFGVRPEQIGDGPAFDYTVWSVTSGGRSEQVCGRLLMNDDWPESIPPHWMTYFAVADCDSSAARVAELGGKVKHVPFDSAYGRIAVVTDPWGATFSIMKLAERAPR
jgi:predicted enzyme related to lactoylglutathione lyase